MFIVFFYLKKKIKLNEENNNTLKKLSENRINICAKKQKIKQVLNVKKCIDRVKKKKKTVEFKCIKLWLSIKVCVITYIYLIHKYLYIFNDKNILIIAVM